MIEFAHAANDMQKVHSGSNKALTITSSTSRMLCHIVHGLTCEMLSYVSPASIKPKRSLLSTRCALQYRYLRGLLKSSLTRATSRFDRKHFSKW